MARVTERRKGWMYFIYTKPQKAMKVGFASNIDQRMASLQSGNPDELHLLGIVPAYPSAEEEFHRYMKPHRIAREWYPDDTLMFGVCSELQEHWGDLVEEKCGAQTWPLTGDEWSNPGEVYLTGDYVRKHLPKIVALFFEIDPDEPREMPMPVNHWAPKPKPKVRKLRPGYN